MKIKKHLFKFFDLFQWAFGILQRLLSWCLHNAWLRLLMRFGFAAKGCLYGLIGGIALTSLWRPQTPISGTYDVLIGILQQAFGKLLLAIFAVGLLGYVLWRLIQAGLAPEGSDSVGIQQIVQRAGYLMSGATYYSVASNAGQLALGFIPEDDDTLEDMAVTLLEHEPGAWLLILGGLAVMGVGLTYMYGGVSRGYLPPLRYLPPRFRQSVHRLGQIGFIARGVGFILIAAYLIKAGLLLDGDSVAQLKGVLERLDEQPLGWLWLSAIAFGFISYAVYMVLASRLQDLPE